MTDKKHNIQINYPILKQDFLQADRIINKQVVRDSDWGIDYLQSLSMGEILLAKIENNVIGVIAQRFSGEIFKEMEDKYFSLEKFICEKCDYGYVVLIAVDKQYQSLGIGKQLLQQALMEQKKFGTKAVGVHCWQSSPSNASQKLFEGFGFKPLKLHIKTWYEHSKRVGVENFECAVCGNPCLCNDLEMIKYI